MVIHGLRTPRITSRALALCLVAGYLTFATVAATCVDHQAGSHHHAGPSAHHHPLCGETQCSGAAIVADGQSALAGPPTCSGLVAVAAVVSITPLSVSLAPSRAPPFLLS
ncbi:MAG: hypothetical protein HY208_06485 [Nitrospirae bacterium]|nr:hypothetical protein [Nitrospirota bacterium]